MSDATSETDTADRHVTRREKLTAKRLCAARREFSLRGQRRPRTRAPASPSASLPTYEERRNPARLKIALHISGSRAYARKILIAAGAHEYLMSSYVLC